MTPRTLVPFIFLAVACSPGSPDSRVSRHAAGRLGLESAVLRVTSQTELESPRHRFHLVSRDGVPLLLVVEPREGELFDARTPDAFDRVARAEDAAARLGQLGAERVALWFGALGGGVCPPPTSTGAHFATVERDAEDTIIRYPAGPGKICAVALAPDGGLRKARLEGAPGPQASGGGWKSEMR
jgi:hypothetical protein